VDPLTDFVYWRQSAPYLAKPPKYAYRAMIVPVRSKTGLVASRRGGIAHLENGIAAEFIKSACVGMGARFLCGGGSKDIAVLPNADVYGGICERCEDVAAGPAVYRCFDTAGALLYIGSTESLLKRLGIHSTRTSWWAEVADVKDVRYPTIFEARGAERQAIIAENPLYNRLPKKRGAA
jgi:hypothetical protein